MTRTIDATSSFSEAPAPKRRELPKFVHVERNRHGVLCYYLRKDRKTPRIRIRGTPGTVEFQSGYAAAVAGLAQPPQSFIYFARAGNKVKIGISKDPRQRLGSIKTGSSSKVRIYYVTPGTREDERRLHQQFSEYRVNGEWFLFAAPIKDWIAQDEARRTP